MPADQSHSRRSDSDHPHDRGVDQSEPIDSTCTRLRPLAEYTQRLPSSRPSRRLNRATLWRWALRGMRGGRKLRTVTAGAARLTCDAWVWEFLTPSAQPNEHRAVSPSLLSATERESIARRLGASPHRKAS